VVNFVVAGFHQIFVYKPGTQPEDIVVPAFPPQPFHQRLQQSVLSGRQSGTKSPTLTTTPRCAAPTCGRFRR
jgi:hypothetical protein